MSTTLEIMGCFFVIRSFITVPGCAARKANSLGVMFFGYVIYHPICMVDFIHIYGLRISIGAAFSQVIIVFMTLFKLVMGRRGDWTRTPLTSLMLKQGLATFFIVLGKNILLGPSSLLLTRRSTLGDHSNICCPS